jgi:hypothetical protein
VVLVWVNWMRVKEGWVLMESQVEVENIVILLAGELRRAL